MQLATTIYNLTESFPDSEKYGLVSQMRRCSVSIPSNIAEGAGRNTNGEFRQFLGIAVGSLFELETQLILVKRLNFIENIKNELEQIDALRKMIYGLQRSFK